MRGAPVTALVLLVLAAAAGSAYAADPPSPTASGSKNPSVKLGSGEVGGDLWSASVRRQQGAAQGTAGAEDRPCIEVSSARANGGSSTVACTFSRRLTPTGGPLWVTTSEPEEAGAEPAMTAVAMVIAPVTAYLEATHVDGTVEKIGLKRLTAGQARRAGLKRLRYTAFAAPGTWCVARLESFDRAGRRLWRSGNVREKSCTVGG